MSSLKSAVLLQFMAGMTCAEALESISGSSSSRGMQIGSCKDAGKTSTASNAEEDLSLLQGSFSHFAQNPRERHIPHQNPTMSTQQTFTYTSDKPYNWTAARHVFQAFSDVLISQKIPFFPMYGTLLQWYRDGDIKKDDHDIDVMILAEDWNRISWSEIGLRAANLSGLPEFAQWPHPVHLETFDKNGVIAPRKFLSLALWFDVWVLHKGRPGHRAICSGWDKGKLFIDELPEFELEFEWAQLWDTRMMAPVPGQIEKILSKVYGPNWRVPQDQNQTDTYRKQTHVMGPDACTKYFLEANGDVKEQKKQEVFCSLDKVTKVSDIFESEPSQYLTRHSEKLHPKTLSACQNSHVVHFNSRFWKETDLHSPPKEPVALYQGHIIRNWLPGIFLLVLLALWFWREGKKSMETEEDTSFFSIAHVYFTCFVIFGAAHMFMPHLAHDMQYNYLCPIIIISVLKIVACLVLHVCEDGCSLSGILQTFRKEHVVFMKYGFQSALYGTYDVLGFVSLTYIDPSSYVVIMQLRLAMTGIMWEIGFQKKMSAGRRVAILVITIACCFKEFGTGHPNQATSDHWSAVILVLVQVVIGCFATVANEILLKHETQVSMNLQNLAQYMWTVVWAFFIGIVCFYLHIERLSLNPLDIYEWRKMMDMRMLPTIVLLSLNGLIVARVLLYMNSLWKAIGDVFKVLVCSLASSVIWGYPITSTDWISFTVLGFGILVFSQG